MKFKRVPAEIPVDSLTPFDITCGSTKCEENLHSYSLKKTALRKFNQVGVCVECGEEIVDWERIHKKDLNDSEYLFSSLKTELIRYVVWKTNVSEETIKRMSGWTLNDLRQHIKKILKQRVQKKTAWDGRQTPKGGDEITNFGQHATATCCRKCMDVWHGISQNKVLSDNELEYCTNLIERYIKIQLPHFYKQLDDK